MANGFEICGREAELLQLRELAKAEIGIVGAVGDLRGRHELEKRGHGRREGRVRGGQL